MRGGDVRQLQQALQAHDIDVSIDGVFGPNSKKALKKFQIQKGLPDSGELDPATRTTLNIE
jgi:peptidoglycan hydrolase-like protein with peptidoglycan-binding domain